MATHSSFTPEQWRDLWESVCRNLEGAIVSHQFHAWIYPLKWQGVLPVSEIEGQTTYRIQLLSPNDFSSRWVKNHYQTSIEKAFLQLTGCHCELELLVQTAPPNQNQSSLVVGTPLPSIQSEIQSDLGFDRKAEEASLIPTVSLSQGKSSGSFPGDMPDPRYTFDNFVVGSSNQFAHASAVAVADQPAKQYNPLFLYSPPGLGKTHLLHAIGNYLLYKNPKARVAYLSAEKFVNELIDALQHRRMPQFRSKYRDGHDIILIDDIQFIAGKHTSEEEFFHTFNALHSSQRQIVVSSDRPPKEIKDLEERVRTRFEWGLVADIRPPEMETRIAILKTKAERDDIYLPDDVASFLASCIKTNVRELEGILIRLQAQASLTGVEISLEMAKHELGSPVDAESLKLTAETIQAIVAKHYKLKIHELKASTRMKSVALPRQIAMYLVRKHTDLGLKEIGQFFGGKDHTTILHACGKIEASLETHPEIRLAIERIQSLF